MAKSQNNNEEEPLTILSFLKNTGIVLLPIGIVGGATKYISNGNVNEKMYVEISVILTVIIIYFVWIELRIRKLQYKSRKVEK